MITIKKYKNDYNAHISTVEILFTMGNHKMQICFGFGERIGPCIYIYDSTKDKYIHDYIGTLNYIFAENNNKSYDDKKLQIYRK